MGKMFGFFGEGIKEWIKVNKNGLEFKDVNLHNVIDNKWSLTNPKTMVNSVIG